MKLVHLKKEYGALSFTARQKEVLATDELFFVSFGQVLTGPGGPESTIFKNVDQFSTLFDQKLINFGQKRPCCLWRHVTRMI